jgi:hypothetical protein
MWEPFWTAPGTPTSGRHPGTRYQCFGSGLDPDSIRLVDPDSDSGSDPGGLK